MTLFDKIQIVFELLRGLHPWHGETETPAQRNARLGIIAAAVVIASEGDRDRAVGLMVQADSETHLSSRIHRGECEGLECDAAMVTRGGRKHRIYLARNLWQVRTARDPELAWLWERSLGDGLAPTLNAARLADYYLQSRRCRGNVSEMYGAQGGGGCHETESSKQRAEKHERLLAKWWAIERRLAK